MAVTVIDELLPKQKLLALGVAEIAIGEFTVTVTGVLAELPQPLLASA